MLSMVTAIILHQYLLHAHMNGRMLDVWRRLNAGENDFFVPHDLEVSAAELHHACVRARRWKGAEGARREVVLHDFHVNEDTSGEAAIAAAGNGGGGGIGSASTAKESPTGDGETEEAGAVAAGALGARATRISTTHVAIYDVSADLKKSLHRQFLRTSDGTILEVFGEAGREVGWQLRSSLNALLQQEAGGSGSTAVAKQEQGVFAGMLPAAPAPAVVAPPAEIPVIEGSGDSGSVADDTSK